MTEGLVDTVAAAEYLGVSHRTLQGWRRRRTGPHYVRYFPRGPVYYRLADLDEWARAHRHHPEDPVEPVEVSFPRLVRGEARR